MGQLRTSLVLTLLCVGVAYGMGDRNEVPTEFRWLDNDDTQTALSKLQNNWRIANIEGPYTDGNLVEPYRRGTLLRKAARNNHIAIVDYLYHHLNISLDKDSHSDDDAPLDAAVSAGHFEMVRHLVDDLGVSVDAGILREREDTPQHKAVRSGHVKIVKYLVEHGASLQGVVSRKTGLSPLNEAVVHGDMEILRYYVEECGVSFDVPEAYYNRSYMPIQQAVAYGNYNVARYLMAFGESEYDVPEQKSFMVLGLSWNTLYTLKNFRKFDVQECCDILPIALGLGYLDGLYYTISASHDPYRIGGLVLYHAYKLQECRNRKDMSCIIRRYSRDIPTYYHAMLQACVEMENRPYYPRVASQFTSCLNAHMAHNMLHMTLVPQLYHNNISAYAVMHLINVHFDIASYWNPYTGNTLAHLMPHAPDAPLCISHCLYHIWHKRGLPSYGSQMDMVEEDIGLKYLRNDDGRYGKTPTQVADGSLDIQSIQPDSQTSHIIRQYNDVSRIAIPKHTTSAVSKQEMIPPEIAHYIMVFASHKNNQLLSDTCSHMKRKRT